MGTAILSGLLKSGFDASVVAVSTNSTASAEKLADELGVMAFAMEDGEDANLMAVADADVVLVAVKPAYVVPVLQEVADSLADDALVISVAAGITSQAMEAALPEDVAVIRSMPNMPAVVSRAVTGISAGKRATAEHLKVAHELFATVGTVVELDESRIDSLSAISGSGPAYVYYLIDQLTAAAKHLGFNDHDATTLVNETFAGAVELLLASGRTPEELRKQVTSPKGTTERAIARIEEADLKTVFAEAVDAAVERSRELAAGN